MQCLKCGTEAKAGKKFCPQCGAHLDQPKEFTGSREAIPTADAPPAGDSLVCSGCGARIPAGRKFCRACGTPVTATAPPPSGLKMESPVAPPPKPLPSEFREGAGPGAGAGPPEVVPDKKTCAACGASVAAGKKFCPSCGCPFAAGAPTAPGLSTLGAPPSEVAGAVPPTPARPAAPGHQETPPPSARPGPTAGIRTAGPRPKARFRPPFIVAAVLAVTVLAGGITYYVMRWRGVAERPPASVSKIEPPPAPVGGQSPDSVAPPEPKAEQKAETAPPQEKAEPEKPHPAEPSKPAEAKREAEVKREPALRAQREQEAQRQRQTEAQERALAELKAKNEEQARQLEEERRRRAELEAKQQDDERRRQEEAALAAAAKPEPAPRPAQAYTGPSSGTLVWEGIVRGESRIRKNVPGTLASTAFILSGHVIGPFIV
ncbi:MAG: zinc ribbon domain-containing protein [Acidobacteria bacterium]|nr:zinc ribbon domain-containing protein [Acidobacteriota bacterium]